VAVERPEAKARFRAVLAPLRVDGDDAVLTREARELLQVEPGERVHVVPFE
jgi:arginine/ornithine N-succinyltransferase beta subunit